MGERSNPSTIACTLRSLAVYHEFLRSAAERDGSFAIFDVESHPGCVVLRRGFLFWQPLGSCRDRVDVAPLVSFPRGANVHPSFQTDQPIVSSVHGIPASSIDRIINHGRRRAHA